LGAENGAYWSALLAHKLRQWVGHASATQFVQPTGGDMQATADML
jgi:hypothetical protein